MTGRPIIFSSSMVRAILAGRKTETRRIIRPQPEGPVDRCHYVRSGWALQRDECVPSACRCVEVKGIRFAFGDRLWVREAWGLLPRNCYALPKTVSPAEPDMAAYYRADFDRSGKPAWKPSIHMPRWASRITLAVTEVRVERVQEITEDGAIAEGVLYVPGHGDITPDELRADPGYSNYLNCRMGFEALWNSLHGPGAWDANQWVSVIRFRPILANIDAQEAA